MRAAREPPLTVLMVDDDTEVLLGRIDARAPDLQLVDALLRMRLDACRRGATVRLRDVPLELLELLQLVGVADLLGLEACGHPEVREPLGVEEVVQPGDPPG